MNMKNLLLPVVALVPMLFCGCMKPYFHSMGVSPMIVDHPARTVAHGDSSEVSVSADAFGGYINKGLNTENGFNAGGTVSFLYRPAGALSPLFVEAAVSGKYGQVKFTDGDDDFDNRFGEWLKTKDGEKSYSFYSIQERITAGADFDLGSYLMLGLGGGVQFFQGGGEFDDKRDELETLRIAENYDDGYGVRPVGMLRVGGRLGKNGILMLEYSQTFASHLADMGSNISLSYSHPTGLHAGLFMDMDAGLGLSLGKTFRF